MLTHEGESLQNYMPHRFENILVDKVEIENEETGHLSLKIGSPDSQHRDIFLKEKQNETLVLISPVMMEVLALGSIVSRDTVVSNQTVVFASISDFEKYSDAPANTLIKGTVSLVSNKKGFLKYKGSLNLFSEKMEPIPVCKGDMLAFFTTEPLDQDQKKETAPLTFPQNSPISPPKHKSPWMHCADAIRSLSDTSITTHYTYPKNHPLTRGHFYGNPLMMGVMQWMSVEDAFLQFCTRQKITGIKDFTCNASLIKENGAIVTDIKDVSLRVWINEPNIPNQTEIMSTKKIAFRNVVRPGETLYTCIENISFK